MFAGDHFYSSIRGVRRRESLGAIRILLLIGRHQSALVHATKLECHNVIGDATRRDINLVCILFYAVKPEKDYRGAMWVNGLLSYPASDARPPLRKSPR